jgi:hypothetical protein
VAVATPAPIVIPCEFEGHCAWVFVPCCMHNPGSPYDADDECVSCFQGWCCCNEDCEYVHEESFDPGFIPQCCVEGTCNCVNQDGTPYVVPDYIKTAGMPARDGDPKKSQKMRMKKVD